MNKAVKNGAPSSSVRQDSEWGSATVISDRIGKMPIDHVSLADLCSDLPAGVPSLDPAVVPHLKDAARTQARIVDLHRQYDEAQAAGRVLELYPIRSDLLVLEALFCTHMSSIFSGGASS